jgi:hypothetical protein
MIVSPWQLVASRREALNRIDQLEEALMRRDDEIAANRAAIDVMAAAGLCTS